MRKPRPDRSPLDSCCLAADPPRHIDVSRCDKHRRIELWINHVPHWLTDRQAEQLALALLAAASGEPGSREPAGDLL
jgi:hypothetical protein